jgi:uncharacterized damage-inducible protein DinB
MPTNYLSDAIGQFEYYKMLGDKTFAQLSDEQLFWQANADSNSIATIVKHLWGNMLSRWTDFLDSDGEKEWRNREAEFDNDILSRAEMLEKWEAGWACLLNALRSLSEADLEERTIYIRNQGHTVTQAINRQLAHYPYHVGQIVFLGKLCCDGNWHSLSIPRGGSQAFNSEKFAQEKEKGSFLEVMKKEGKL